MYSRRMRLSQIPVSNAFSFQSFVMMIGIAVGDETRLKGDIPERCMNGCGPCLVPSPQSVALSLQLRHFPFSTLLPIAPSHVQKDVTQPHRLTAAPGRSQIRHSESILQPCLLPNRALHNPYIHRHTRKYLYLTALSLPSLTHPQFQLRFCPSLANKPIPKLEKPTPIPKKHFDPFANPSPELHIIDIPTTSPTHLLVLNKFPIIAGHFILATKTNKQQTHVLEQDDLEATYACLKAWGEGSKQGSKQKRLFAFFNSGDHSGASQPHRHLQFLPVENMRDSEAANGWDVLIDLILAGEEGTGEFAYGIRGLEGTAC